MAATAKEYVTAQGLAEELSDALSRVVEERPEDGLTRLAHLLLEAAAKRKGGAAPPPPGPVPRQPQKLGVRHPNCHCPARDGSYGPERRGGGWRR